MSFRSDEVALERGEWRPWGLIGVTLLAMPLFGLAVLFTGKGAGAAVLAVFACIVAVGLRRLRPLPGEVFADRRGLVFNGKKLVDRESLSSAEVTGSHVKLGRCDRRETIRLQMKSPGHARALVAALELDASRKAARFLLEGSALTFGPLVLGSLAALALLMSALVRSLIMAIVGAVALAIVIARAILERPRMSVGADGVVIERYLRRRFIPFRDVARVDPIDAVPDYVTGARSWVHVQLTLRSGEHVRVPIEQPHGKPKAELIAPALIQRIAEASRVGGHAPPQSLLDQRILRRGGASAVRWLERLRALGVDPGYRRAGTSQEALWRILGDHEAEPSARVGAAVALRSMGHERDDERLRIAVDTVAEPRLQRALRIAADAEEDAELIAALDEMKEEDAAS